MIRPSRIPPFRSEGARDTQQPPEIRCFDLNFQSPLVSSPPPCVHTSYVCVRPSTENHDKFKSRCTRLYRVYASGFNLRLRGARARARAREQYVSRKHKVLRASGFRVINVADLLRDCIPHTRVHAGKILEYTSKRKRLNDK